MLLDLILKRRSVRKYLSRPIPKQDLLKCIEAARLAPSAQNAQPWRFIIVDQPELKDKICQRAFSGVYAINRFAINAPVLIVVVSEKERFLRTVTKYFRGTNFYLIDIGIACEHLCLEATELGIGSCWLGWFNEKAVKEILQIPRDKKIDVIMSLGYFIEDKLKKKSRKSLEEMSSFNVYK